MAELVLGCFFIVMSLMPGFIFREGRLGTKGPSRVYEAAWVGRVIFGLLGLGLVLTGIYALIHHRR
jgi:hypothetical protein